LGLDDLEKKLENIDQFSYKLTNSEREQFEQKCEIPYIAINNTISLEETGLDMLRLHGVGSRCSASYLRTYIARLRNVYELRQFPFDTQSLPMHLRVKDFHLWQGYLLTVDSVQLFKDCLSLSEWEMLRPTVARGSPRDSLSTVFVNVRRHHSYYLEHVVFTMFALEALGLLVFALDPSLVGAPLRATLVVTLMLTVVAVKFTVRDAIPSVPYSTLLDLYFFICFGGLVVIAYLSVVPQFVSELSDQRVWVNIALAGVSVVFVFGGLIGWFYFARCRVEKVRVGKAHVVVNRIENGKNFYCFRFCTPPHLDNSVILSKMIDSVDNEKSTFF
jgi:hypothetical protein